MAGSYNHCVDEDGQLLNNEDLVGMLENGGDVYEAVEEMYGMIWWLADRVRVAESDRMFPGDPEPRSSQFVEQARPLVVDAVEYEPDAVAKHLSSPELAGHIAALVDGLAQTTPFDEAQVEAAVRNTATARGIKAGALIHATRVAVTGRTMSPGLFELLAWLGPDRTRARLTRLLEFLATRV